MALMDQKAQKEKKGVRLISLASTSPNSWAETDRKAIDNGRATLEADDRRGPISLAVVAELEPQSRKTDAENPDKDDPQEITGKGRIVVFGDVDFASNKYIRFSGNGDFVFNTINYLAARKELITITKKHKPIEALMLDRTQGMVAFWIPVVVIPLSVLILGFMVWFRRRSR